LRGVESMFGNVAGLSRVNKTEVLFSSTQWLSGSGVLRGARPDRHHHVLR
jgi:hypothetical protein